MWIQINAIKLALLCFLLYNFDKIVTSEVISVNITSKPIYFPIEQFDAAYYHEFRDGMTASKLRQYPSESMVEQQKSTIVASYIDYMPINQLQTCILSSFYLHHLPAPVSFSTPITSFDIPSQVIPTLFSCCPTLFVPPFSSSAQTNLQHVSWALNPLEYPKLFSVGCGHSLIVQPVSTPKPDSLNAYPQSLHLDRPYRNVVQAGSNDTSVVSIMTLLLDTQLFSHNNTDSVDNIADPEYSLNASPLFWKSELSPLMLRVEPSTTSSHTIPLICPDLHMKQSGEGFHRKVTTVWTPQSCRSLIDNTTLLSALVLPSQCSFSVLYELNNMMFVDPYQLQSTMRSSQAVAGRSEEHVGEPCNPLSSSVCTIPPHDINISLFDFIDIEAPMTHSHGNLIAFSTPMRSLLFQNQMQQQSHRHNHDDDDDEQQGVSMSFDFDLHLRYAVPQHPDAISLFKSPIQKIISANYSNDTIADIRTYSYLSQPFVFLTCQHKSHQNNNTIPMKPSFDDIFTSIQTTLLYHDESSPSSVVIMSVPTGDSSFFLPVYFTTIIAIGAVLIIMLRSIRS